MSTLLHWFTSPEWAQIVKTLLHSLWQGALIALALAVFMRRLANPVSRYRCSLTALACVVVAGIITWAVMNTADGRTPSPVQNQPTAENQNAHNFAATMDASPEDKIIVTANRTPAATSMRWTAWLALVWLAGAGAMLARAGVKVAGAEKLRRSCQPLNDSRVEKLLAEARRAVSLARQVRVGVTDKLTSPAVVGIFVPMLILPLSLLTTLTPEQIHFVLLHELAHIRRGDYLANLFQFFAESLLFFNPAVWWISHQVRREREACCDALAIELSGAPVDYARTLVHVAENMLQPASAAATAFSEKREPSSLIDRVQRLLVPGYRPSLRLTWRAMLAALVLGSALLVLSATGTRMTVAAILTPEQRTEQIEKKMTEVGQKPETMSDSAEQNKEMKSSATNITDNPQGTVRFEIDLYIRFANLQKLSGLRETNSLEEQLQKLFSEAGVKPPLTNVMITKEGTLVVRGTKEQLDLVMKVVQHLMMTSHNNSRTLTNENLNLAEAGTLLQDGKLLWEMDKLTEAEAKLRKALDLDPQNYAAAYYLSLVHEARLNVATSRRGSDAQTMVHTNLIYTSKGRQAIANKLDRIHLDSIVFPAGGLPLSEVLRNLSEESKKRDPEKRGINFIINSGVESAPAAAPVEGGGGLPAVPAEPLDLGAVIVKLNPGLTDVRLADVLDAVVKVAERPIKYSIEDYAVVFSQRGAESAQLYTRWFRVDPNTFSEGLNSVIAATFGVSGSSGGGGGQQGGGGSSGGGGGGGNNGGTRSTVARVSVTGGGAGGTTPGGAGAGGAGGDGIRFVTSNNTMQDQQVAVRLFFTTMGVDLNPLLGKNLFFNDKSGVLFVRATLQDLDIIETAIQALNVAPPMVNIKARFAEISQNDNRALGFDWYLGNVLMDNGKIGAQAVSHPSFIVTSKGRQAIVSKLDSIRLGSVQYDNLPLIGVFSNLAQQVKALDPDKHGVNFIVSADITSLPITIHPALTDVRLGDVLEAIIKGADKPIKYSLEDYAVVFSLRTDRDLPQLYTRMFKVDTNVFLSNLRKQTGLTSTNAEEEIKALRKLFSDAGADLQPTNKAVFYNDRNGTLFVRVTLKDLDAIESAIQKLNYAPPLISIKIKFIAVPDQGTGDLFLGTLGSNSVSSMSSPETPVPPVGNNSSNGEPLLTSGLRMRSADTTSTLTGILTPAQARQVLQALESNPNAKVIATPSVTTANGRQAQIQIVDVMTIVKGINPQALTPPGITTTNEAEIYKMEEMRFGPVIDLIPYLSEGGYTIQLTAIPSVTEFLGYDKPTNSVTVYVNGKKQSVQPPLPHIHTQKISSSVVVWDGQTVVLGGLISEEVSKVKDKTPILGDLPLVGSAFRSESSTTTKKKVLVFITPTLVDPAGNRLHTDEDMPSAQNGVPVQAK